MAEDRATYKQGVDVMIRQMCADVLMDILLNVALKQVKWALAKEFLGHFFAQWAMLCDGPMSEPLDMFSHGIWYANEQKKLEIRAGCYMSLVFDVGVREMPKYVPDWATTLWPFDPGGCLYLYA